MVRNAKGIVRQGGMKSDPPSSRARESAPWTFPDKRVARNDPTWRPKLTMTQARELKSRGLMDNETYWQRRRDKMKHADAIKGL